MSLQEPCRFVALLMALPTLAGALGLATINMRGPLFFPPRQVVSAPADALADALRRRSMEDAFASIRAGQDPNEPIEYRDGGHTIQATPLVLAVAQRDPNTVLMLLSFGADPDLILNHFAGCLANSLGDPEIARIMREAASDPREECPVIDPAAPLLGHVISDPGAEDEQ
jgi:hypothetical protein